MRRAAAAVAWLLALPGCLAIPHGVATPAGEPVLRPDDVGLVAPGTTRDDALLGLGVPSHVEGDGRVLTWILKRSDRRLFLVFLIPYVSPADVERDPDCAIQARFDEGGRVVAARYGEAPLFSGSGWYRALVDSPSDDVKR